jgi:dienelactone hydrolase
MRPVLLLLLLATFVFAIAACNGPAGAETVVLHPAQYTDFREVMSGGKRAAEAALPATLTFPETARSHSPAVVVVHTLGGYLEENEGWHAAQFRKAGFATLTYDSPSARSMRQAALSGSPSGARVAPPWATALSEAYAALDVLAADPRIDADRIAIVGFSFGGEIAHLAAFEPLRHALAEGQRRYAAHVAYYPAGVYGAVAQPQAYTGAPVLMLLGEKDDNLPIEKAQAYVRYINGAPPVPVEVSIYPGAYHAWTVPAVGAARFHPEYPSTRKCPYILLGSPRPGVLVGGREGPLEPDALRAYLQEGRGYTMGYDEPARDKAAAQTVDFLVRTLGN